MNRKKFKVLLIDDDGDYAFLIREFLSPRCERFVWVQDDDEALNLIESFSEFDAVLVDYYLKEQSGLQLITRAREKHPYLPMILLTAMDDGSVDDEALSSGASDYLDKGEITPSLLERAIRYGIQRSQTLEALSRMEAKHRALILNSSDLIQIVSLDGRILYDAPSALKILGYSSTERMGQKFLETVYPEDRNRVEDFLNQASLQEGRISTLEYRVRCKDGAYTYMESAAAAAFNEPLIQGLILNSRDVSERKLSEDQIRAYTRKIEDDLKEKDRSLRKAQKIQQKLNTRVLPDIEDMSLITCYMPSEELGGDYFNVWREDDRLMILMADCTGHGIDAAMDSVLVKSVSDRYLHLLAGDRPDLFLQAVNADMIEYFAGQDFFTMFAGVLNLNDRTLWYSNANSELPYLQKNGRVRRLPSAEGFHIGFQEKGVFEKKRFQLEEDEMLFICSDSLREIMTESREILGQKGVENLVKDFGQGILKDFNGLLSELLRLNGRLPLKDDTTLILLSFIRPFKKIYQAHTQNRLNEIEEEITTELEKRNYSPEEIQRIRVSYEEMATNALTHGNQCDPAKIVTVESDISCLKASFVIRDEGKGFCPESVLDPTDIQRIREWMDKDETEKYTHGRGIFLTRKYAGEVVYNERGNEVRISFKRGKKETFFLYFCHEDPQESGKQDATSGQSCFFWHPLIDERQFLFSRHSYIEIFFPAEVFLGSEDLRKIFILYQDALKNGKLIKAYFENPGQAQILKDLKLPHEGVLEISLKKQVSGAVCTLVSSGRCEKNCGG